MAEELRHPELEAAAQWAATNQRLLARTFERFQEHAEWPTLESLQLDFSRGGEEIDVRALAFAIPRPLGFVEQQRLVLLAHCLQYLPTAAPLLAAWFSSLQIASRRWLSETEESCLTRDDVLRATDGDQDLALQVSQILLRERWAFGSGRGTADDPNWSQEVISDVRIVRNARGPEELLAARDRQEHPLPAAAPEEPSATLAPPQSEAHPRWRQPASWAKEHYWGAVAAGLTVLIAWAFLNWGYSDLFGGSSGNEAGGGTTSETGADTAEPSEAPPPGKGIVEQAGEEGARTYRNPHTLSQTGPNLEPFEHVRVGCRVNAPTMPSVSPDGNWYKILSPPWKGRYYAPANSFWNGDIPGQFPYTHNTDFHVPECR